MNTEELFAKLTKAIAYLYSEDPTVPGLLVSSLRNGTFYVSVQRFLKSGAKEKVVVFKTTNDNLYNALLDVANWVVCQSVHTNPIDELRRSMLPEDAISPQFYPDDVRFPDYDDSFPDFSSAAPLRGR